MSNDEQAPYVEVDARTEPVLAAHRMVAEPAEPAQRLIGTAVPENVPLERLEPLEPMQWAVPAQPLLPRERMGLPVQPLQPFEQAAEPEQARLRPMGLSEPQARTAASRTTASGNGGSGGAGTGFQVDPAQYRAAVSPMLAASEQVASIYRSLNAFLPSLEAQNPWGNDESGKKFAEGEKGYLQFSHDSMKVIKDLPGNLKMIADGLKMMADSYRNADEDVVSELGGIESTAPMPVAPSIPPSPLHLPITPGMTQSGRH
ncbi:hypothetical protein KNE206_66710 [Kitasatospora sp. NE20-6]|uniref:WXG100 family type VII secretion target n=1 Tax=Kitasatospora sp. NE20-6 TaxID=2859066 RepID=UPI0034DBD440